MERLKEIANELKKFADELQEIAANPSEGSEERMALIERRSNELINERNALLQLRASNLRNGFENGQVLPTPSDVEERARLGQELINKRSITLSGNLTVVPHENNATEMTPTFNQVSRLIDLVSYKSLPKGNSFKQPYMKNYGFAGVTAEGADAPTSEPDFGSAEITKVKLTAYAEVSEEFKLLAPEFYYDEVKKNMSIAIRKTLAAHIISGTGGTNGLTGILASSSTQTALETSKDIEITKIDENTLDEIVLNFGGDENAEDTGVLILNKKDLLAFAKVRGSDKRKVYDINYKNNTINNVPYVISSSVKSLEAAADGEYSLTYGLLSQYLVAIFDDITIQESTDFKFKSGMIAIKATLMTGGNVVGWNAFLRVKKKAAEGK